MGDAENEELLDSELNTEAEGEEGASQDEPSHDEGSATSEGAGTADGGEGEEEEVVGFGDEEAPASEEAKAAPQWVKDLRAEQKRLKRENAELKARQNTGQVQGKPELPPKPTMADHGYDEEKFEQARDAWDAKKREVDSWEANQRKAAEVQQQAARAVDEQYAKDRAALKVNDYQEREDSVADALDPIQQAILKKGASNAARMVAALGSNPKKLQELASIKDPVKFAVAVGKLETEVKVTKRTSTKPAPETTVRSSGSPTTAGSKATLDRLEAEAAKTGDRSKIVSYKRKLQQGQK